MIRIRITNSEQVKKLAQRIEEQKKWMTEPEVKFGGENFVDGENMQTFEIIKEFSSHFQWHYWKVLGNADPLVCSQHGGGTCQRWNLNDDGDCSVDQP